MRWIDMLGACSDGTRGLYVEVPELREVQALRARNHGPHALVVGENDAEHNADGDGDSTE